MIRTYLPILAMLLFPVLATAADPLAGRWSSGQWTSDANGHHGPLRGRVTPRGDGYDVRFAGRFAKVIPFSYKQHLDLVGTDGDTVFLAAQRRLFVFGTFQMDGVATPTSFDATFRSGKDSGRFTLRR